LSDSAPGRTAAVPPAPAVRSTSTLRLVVAGVVVLGALAFLLLRLGDATVYFRTADEAVAQRASLGDRRFRIEGVVVAGSVKQAGNDVTFAIEENGATVPVRHTGDPPELFQADIPVVLEGHFTKGSDVFASDRIMVKHSESYNEDHPDRTKDYVGK
jgi:cytochrome c-type biogenesis protein CcmE